MQRTRRVAVWLVAAATILAARGGPLGGAVASSARAQQGQAPAGPPPGQAPSGAQAAASLPPQARTFTGDVGLLINYIKPDKSADFEAIIGKLKEALARGASPERKAQAAGWRTLKMTEPLPNGNLVYVFLFDPVAKSTDYSPSRILAEAFPDETVDLFKRYTDCFAGGVGLANFEVVADMREGREGSALR